MTLCGRLWEINSWWDAGRNGAVISDTELHSAAPASTSLSPKTSASGAELKLQPEFQANDGLPQPKKTN